MPKLNIHDFLTPLMPITNHFQLLPSYTWAQMLKYRYSFNSKNERTVAAAAPDYVHLIHHRQMLFVLSFEKSHNQSIHSRSQFGADPKIWFVHWL